MINNIICMEYVDGKLTFSLTKFFARLTWFVVGLGISLLIKKVSNKGN